MRRFALLLLVTTLLIGCSGDATDDESVESTAIGFNCASMIGSTWRSVEELLGGEAPGGGHTTEHWVIEFGEGRATWWHTDTALDVLFQCEEGTLTAGASWREINPEAVSARDGSVLMRWHGDLYERVESFYDIP